MSTRNAYTPHSVSPIDILHINFVRCSLFIIIIIQSYSVTHTCMVYIFVHIGAYINTYALCCIYAYIFRIVVIVFAILCKQLYCNRLAQIVAFASNTITMINDIGYAIDRATCTGTLRKKYKHHKFQCAVRIARSHRQPTKQTQRSIIVELNIRDM